VSVYTTLESHDIERLLVQYELGTLVEFQGIAAGIENTNYFVTTQAGPIDDPRLKRFVLTLFETTPAVSLDAYFDLMANLTEHNLPSARPYKTLGGSYLCELKTKPAVLIEKLPGHSVNKPNVAHCLEVGKFLADMHILSCRNSSRLENFRGANWRESVIEKLGTKCNIEEASFLQYSHERVCQFENSALPMGTIHGDLFHDNALFSGGALSGVIDFYYAHDAPYIYDLAVAFADWCFVQNDGEIHYENAVSMLRGYAAVRPISELEREQWTMAIELASLRFLLSRLHDKHFPRQGSLTQEKNPQVFRDLLVLCRKTPERFLDLFQ
jgi:homoserine kinase type II